MDDYFRKQILGEFISHGEDNILYKAAKEYHIECEEFDKKICSGKNNRGIPVPIDSHEMGIINKHALSVRKRIIRELNKIGISAKEFHDAVYKSSKYNENQE